MLADITPVLLTHNEAPNIARTLAPLRWARDIVIVDSDSDDGTVAMARTHGAVRVFRRSFDTHAGQWTHAVMQTGIATPWVLALDADYRLSEELVAELAALQPAADVVGYQARFIYCIGGRPLRASLYPPVTVLFRRAGCSYVQDGHTHRVRLAGRIEALRAPIYHDDRKPLVHWRQAQRRYMALEAAKLSRPSAASRGRVERVRRLRVVAPVAVAVYCLVVRGLLLAGVPGLIYTAQRVYAECLLSGYLLRQDAAAFVRVVARCLRSIRL